MTKRLFISGRVQGVGFRYSMFYAAQNNGVFGWVRNRRDGRVEALIQGEEKAVQACIDWAWKGPGLAVVEGVEVLEATGDFTEFKVEDTV